MQGAELELPDQIRMVAGLQALLQAARPDATIRLIETHISFVLVGPDHAFKFKKAVNPGFLDFTTLARRRQDCLQELRLNRRLAPALYLDVIPVTGTVEAPRLGGSGMPIDFALRMRAFAQDDLWDRVAARGALREHHIDELAESICAFHRDAAVAHAQGPFGAPEQVRAPMLDNLAALDALWPQAAAGALLQALRRWEAQAFAALRGVLAERLRDGRVRECHGDLHLGNVALIDGRSTAFDCIEFNDEFRWIDVMSDLAFMAMDLQAHGLRRLSNRLVNAYLQCSGDYAGARVLRYYAAYRALVRAKVAALRAGQAAAPGPSGLAPVDDPARHYLDLALETCRPARPALMVTHGYSGSGKTTLTEGLLEQAGAIRIRSDVERKRLAGLDPAARSGSALHAGLYSAASTAATYERLCELARPVLRGGYHALLDATFLQRGQRAQARRLAAEEGVPFVLIDFEADVRTLRERLRQRAALGGDASEADLQVLQAQMESAEPLAADERAQAVRCAGGADWSALLRRLD